QPLRAWVGLHPAFNALVEAVMTHFERDGETEWNQQLEISAGRGIQVLLLRGTRLPKGADSGYVLVFDDVTTLLQAQRDAAWGEVARRLAHEIKNPLTPIMLSAERLEHKLSAKLDGEDAAMLQRATHNIVSQVSAMKSMVDEFSEYARSPVANLSELDLNRLVQDVLALYESQGVAVAVELQPDLPALRGDATLMRQVLHNLLKNAHDALEGGKQSLIRVKTSTEHGMVKLAISDNGPGFPPEILTRAFEPYVTTKRQGTGLGLAIVKKIIEEHKGSIKIENLPQGGASIQLRLPVSEGSAV
ncbi:MAG: GHKL domain-containing protein, partial [Methylobacterium sp.]|nr:GHKL domain-containing protein [Methylobacterium sp.]